MQGNREFCGYYRSFLIDLKVGKFTIYTRDFINFAQKFENLF